MGLYDPTPKVRDFSESWQSAKEKNLTEAMSRARQKLHDRLPKEVAGPVGQQIVDSLVDVLCQRDLALEPRFHVVLRFRDPDGNEWDLHRTMTYTLDPKSMADAEHYLFDHALGLHRDEVAQLAMVLT